MAICKCYFPFFISCSVTFCCCITTSSTPEIDKKLSLIDREIKEMPYYFGIAGKIAHRFKGRKRPATNNCFETHLFGCMATFKCSASHIPPTTQRGSVSFAKKKPLATVQASAGWRHARVMPRRVFQLSLLRRAVLLADCQPVSQSVSCELEPANDRIAIRNAILNRRVAAVAQRFKPRNTHTLGRKRIVTI